MFAWDLAKTCASLGSWNRWGSSACLSTHICRYGWNELFRVWREDSFCYTSASATANNNGTTITIHLCGAELKHEARLEHRTAHSHLPFVVALDMPALSVIEVGSESWWWPALSQVVLVLVSLRDRIQFFTSPCASAFLRHAHRQWQVQTQAFSFSMCSALC